MAASGQQDNWLSRVESGQQDNWLNRVESGQQDNWLNRVASGQQDNWLNRVASGQQDNWPSRLASGPCRIVLASPHDHLDWPRLSDREQFKEGDEEADRGNDWKTTSKSGLVLNRTSYYGKLRTAKSGGRWL